RRTSNQRGFAALRSVTAGSSGDGTNKALRTALPFSYGAIAVHIPRRLRYKPVMSNKRNHRDLVNGVPELLLLRLLSQRPKYGYDSVQAIRHSTHAELDFGEGCIYPLLHRLESQQLLCGRRSVVNGRSRVVYRLTEKGQRQLNDSAALWKRVAAAV